jgi:carbamoyl-phosphate synthase large subunit
LLDIAIRHEISLIIPTIDTEMPYLAKAAHEFRGRDILLVVSSSETITLAQDKSRFNAWLRTEGFPAPRQAELEHALEEPSLWVPGIVKPKSGSASAGVRRIETIEQLLALRGAPAGILVEELAPGREFTTNLFVANGKCICAVPHERIETRGGEVSKGITRRDPALIDTMACIAERLPGAFGPLNIQAFVDDRGGVRVTELNARFGGGFPLAYEAGADFPGWLIAIQQGKPIPEQFRDWEADMLMLRYDQARFVRHA